MTESNTPQTFVVGEIVTYFRGADGRESPVKVVGVEGTNVTVDLFGNKVLFVPRKDGTYIRENAPDFAAIYRRKGEVKKSFAQKVRSFLSSS